MSRQSLLLSALLMTAVTVNAQTADSSTRELTPEVVSTMQTEIKKEEQSLTSKLKQAKAGGEVIEFTLDTFRVQRLMDKCMDYNSSTAGNTQAIYNATSSYDSLLNKYYKELLLTLQPADRQVLIAAQRAWLVYRDAEAKLIETVSKKEYTGGGTMQLPFNAYSGMKLVKDRTVAIFDYYLRATQSN